MQDRQEINEIIDRLPNEVLSDLLYYLREVEKKSTEQMRLSINLNTILLEDKEVLERLANYSTIKS
ncbi:MAG: hypothetical protein AAF847_08225 [Bacteroidota bacterium]